MGAIRVSEEAFEPGDLGGKFGNYLAWTRAVFPQSCIIIATLNSSPPLLRDLGTRIRARPTAFRGSYVLSYYKKSGIHAYNLASLNRKDDFY